MSPENAHYFATLKDEDDAFHLQNRLCIPYADALLIVVLTKFAVDGAPNA